MKKKIAIIGAGGHSKVIIDIIYLLGSFEIIGIFDDNKTSNFLNIPILGKIYEIEKINKNILIDSFFIGIGNDDIRKKVYDMYPDLNWEILIHPKSIISDTAKISKGTLVCAGAIIQTEVKIGKQCIINTNCNIDHESIIGNFISICPGVTICGQVKIGNNTLIGANAVIIQNKNVGNNCIIGAGSVVIRDIDNDKKVVGNPGRIIN